MFEEVSKNRRFGYAKMSSQIQDLKENKNLSTTEISKITGRARNTIYKILKEKLNYIPYNRL